MNGLADLGDVLSAASLLLTVVALLYAVWSNAIDEASNLPIRHHPEDNRAAFEKAGAVYHRCAVPLAASSVIFAVAFLPVSLEILWRSIGTYRAMRSSAFRTYDVIATTAVLVNAAQVLLGVHLITVAFRLRRKWKQLDPG